MFNYFYYVNPGVKNTYAEKSVILIHNKIIKNLGAGTVFVSNTVIYIKSTTFFTVYNSVFSTVYYCSVKNSERRERNIFLLPCYKLKYFRIFHCIKYVHFFGKSN